MPNSDQDGWDEAKWTDDPVTCERCLDVVRHVERSMIVTVLTRNPHTHTHPKTSTKGSNMSYVEEIADGFGLFSAAGFPARWHCGQWPEWLVWLHISSDITITTAYLAMPIVIIYYMRRRKELPFTLLFWLFAAFILFCGIGHALEAVIFWYPVYPL